MINPVESLLRKSAQYVLDPERVAPERLLGYDETHVAPEPRPGRPRANPQDSLFHETPDHCEAAPRQERRLEHRRVERREPENLQKVIDLPPNRCLGRSSTNELLDTARHLIQKLRNACPSP